MTPKAAPPLGRRIEITPGPKPRTLVTGKEVSPEQTWMVYFRKHDMKPTVLKEQITLLNFYKKFRDVRAMLVGFLTYHSSDAEPWMYEALALSIKMNRGNDSDVRKALGYAADLAVRSGNPNHLVSVADQLLLMNDLERVGPLLDQAAGLVPHRAEPLAMSINLALKTKDPKRMGDSVETLLSLGWPGVDETIRRDARKQVEALAKVLREDGRGEEADALLARLPEAEARDLFIRLSWLGDAGLDLVVDEPLGATARLLTPRTVFGGSLIKDGYGKHPEEVYVCPRGFDGEYTVRVETAYNNPEKPALQATVEVITHEGTPREHKETHTVTLGSKAPEPIKVTLKGGRRKQALPFLAPVVPPRSQAAKGGRSEPPAAGSR